VEVEEVALVAEERMDDVVPRASSHMSPDCTLPPVAVAADSMGSTYELALAQPIDRVLEERQIGILDELRGRVSVSPCISFISDIFTSIAWRWWRYLPHEARSAPWPLVSRCLPVVLHRDSSSLSSTQLCQVSRRSELRIRRKRVFGLLAELPAYINSFSLEV
jgi:hypothetical protein